MWKPASRCRSRGRIRAPCGANRQMHVEQWRSHCRTERTEPRYASALYPLRRARRRRSRRCSSKAQSGPKRSPVTRILPLSMSVGIGLVAPVVDLHADMHGLRGVADAVAPDANVVDGQPLARRRPPASGRRPEVYSAGPRERLTPRKGIRHQRAASKARAPSYNVASFSSIDHAAVRGVALLAAAVAKSVAGKVSLGESFCG